MIETGSDAPDFDLKVDSSTRVRLSDFRGRRNVLLVFHPFAFTAVCEEEALDLQENLPAFESAETDVLLVSCDPAPARQAWKEKLGLTYTLPSDFWPHGEAARAYGVFDENAGAPVRGTFLIDKDGVVVWSLVNEAGTRRTRADLGSARSSGRVTLARYEWGDDESARARLPARRHEPRPALPPARRAPRRRASTSSRSICVGTATRPGSRRGTSSSTSPTCSMRLRRDAAPGSVTPSEAVLPTRRQLRHRIASSGSFCSIPRSGFPRTSVW